MALDFAARAGKVTRVRPSLLSSWSHLENAQRRPLIGVGGQDLDGGSDCLASATALAAPYGMTDIEADARPPKTDSRSSRAFSAGG